jgi:hypothetical protein
MPNLRLPKAYSQFGASMGRRGNTSERQYPIKMHLNKVLLDSGGYDNGGAYWGLGSDLYRGFGEGELEIQEIFVRGDTRGHAIDEVLKVFPQATFYRGDKEFWWTSSSGRIEFKITSQCLSDCAHSGDCNPGATAWGVRLLSLLSKYDSQIIVDELAEYGAWTREELASLPRTELNSILIWVAASDVKYNNEADFPTGDKFHQSEKGQTWH